MCARPADSCEAGATRCTADGRQTCNRQGEWEEAVHCPPGQECREEAGGAACIETNDECVAGVTDCVGGQLKTCSLQQRWGAVVACPPAQECRVVEGVAGCQDIQRECEAGASRCGPNGRQTCQLDGTWDAGVACPVGQICREDAPNVAQCAADPDAPECVPGASQCDGALILSCNAAGQWDEPRACPGRAGCREEAGVFGCVELPPECQPGEIQCNGDGTQACVDGGWDRVVVACPAGETCRDAAVGCEPIDAVSADCQAACTWMFGIACHLVLASDAGDIRTVEACYEQICSDPGNDAVLACIAGLAREEAPCSDVNVCF